MAHRDSAFAVILRRDQVLVVNPADRKSGPCRRRHQAEETPWIAALREVREETGLDARLLALTGMYRRRDGSLAFVFAARVGWHKVPKGRLNEIAKRRWMPLEKAMRRLPGSSRIRLADALRQPSLYRSAPIARYERQTLRFSIG